MLRRAGEITGAVTGMISAGGATARATIAIMAGTTAKAAADACLMPICARFA